MLLADCGALEIHAQAKVTITGTLDNRCLGDAADAGDLVIRTEGGNPIAIGTPEITVPLLSDGGLDISNDSTLEDWEFDVLPYQRSSVPVAPVCSAYASPLAGPGIEGLPLAVRFRGDGADPDGGPVTYLWNFGDGGSSTDEEPEHEYAAGASYDVTLTVTDDDGESCVATARVTNAEAEPAVALLPALLVVEVGEPLSLAAYSKGATSHAWEFGDGTQSAAESVEHAYASPGRYEVTLQAADGGATIEARAAVWVYPHPPAPAPLAARNRDGEFGSYINGHYRPSRSEDSGYLSRGRDTRIELKGDVIIASGCLLHAQDGFEPPTVSHYFQASGAMGGRGGDVWLGPTGDLTIEAGATIEGGDGGKGGGAVVRSEQGSGIAKGGLGGSGGDVHLYGPEEVSLGGAGAVTRIRAGSGVTGGDAVVDFSIVDDFPDCWEPSASRGKADAVGGDGGEGGTLTLINRDVTGVNTLAGGGNGGAGGAATATAVRGYSSTCDGPAAGRRGGQAVALGGDGGAVRQKRLEGLDVAFGSFRTGDGGAAIANGGHGGNATSAPSQSCAEAEATGGEGGPAEALGGEVGRNLGGRGPATYGKGGDAQANGGAGGDAAASAQACTPCLPGGRAYAYGGRGGPAGAVGGTPSIPGTGSAGDALGRGGDGGDSSAYGGTGGDCTFCPDGAGGNGGLAVADAGEGAGASGSGTTVEGDSGDSLAAGGAGGRGASCCEPPTYGGDGGAGGNAIVYTPPAGDPAVASSSGGLGGSGGDGVPQGAGGPGGEGIVVGAPGVDGEPCPPSSLEAGAVRVPFADAGNSSPNGFRRGATGTWLVSSGDVTYVPTAPQQQQQIASAALAGAQPHAQAAGTARQVTLPGIEPYDVVELDDGSAIVAGRTLTTFRGWLGRLLADGSLAWQMTVQEAKSFRTLARVDASTVVAAFEDVANSQVHVLRFSTAGTVVSTTKLTTPAQSLVKAILPLAGGGLLIAVNAGLILPTDAIVIRIDSGGTIAWQQRFGRVSMVSLLEASGDLYLVGS
jgi:PKD repeat protein